MSKDILCSSCIESIFCPTWAEWKCKKFKKRIYFKPTICKGYKERPKNFEEPKCQCENCLRNDILTDETYEKMDKDYEEKLKWG